MRTKILTIGTMGLAGLVAGGLMALPMTANAASGKDQVVKRDEDTPDVVLVTDDDDDDGPGAKGTGTHTNTGNRHPHQDRDEHQHPDRHPQRSRQQPQPRREGLHQGRSRWSQGRPLP